MYSLKSRHLKVMRSRESSIETSQALRLIVVGLARTIIYLLCAFQYLEVNPKEGLP